MRLVIAIAGMLLCACPLMAETYSWTDDSGTVNFADDLSLVPNKYRKKVRTSDGIDSRAETAVQPAVDSAPKNNADKAPVKQEIQKPEADKSYGGRSLEDWKRELIAAEAELKKLDARVKELKATVNNPEQLYVTRSEFEARQRYNEAVKSFNSASARYDEMVKSARIAGVPL